MGLVLNHFQNYQKQLDDDIQHPIKIAESFRTGSSINGTYKIKQTTEGLVKLLMYGDYVKAKAAFQNVPYQSIVEEDLKKYRYKRKPIKISVFYLFPRYK